MKNNEEAEERNFTYILADSDVIISKRKEEITNALMLSRVFINDTQLQRQSETDKVTAKLENVDLNDDRFGGEIAVEQPDKSLALENSPSWRELPASFGGSKKSDKYEKYKKRSPKKREYETDNGGALLWLHRASFDEYWQYTSEYLIYYTWFKLMGDQLEDKEQMEMKVKSAKPHKNYVPLIDQHEEAELNVKYVNLVKGHSDFEQLVEKPEDLYEKHCEMVKDQAEKDFASYKLCSTRVRCRDFFTKVEMMGFSTGVVDKDIKNPLPTAVQSMCESEIEGTSESSQESMVQEEEPPKAKKGRFPVVYGDDEVFSDITYEIYDKLSGYGKNLLGSRHNKSKPSESVDSGVHSVIESTSSEPVDIKDVEFHFDPATEPHLLASNAHNYYKYDSEIRKYFYQRYRLFSKLDQGIIMDREGWFSVTPERIASHIADRIVTRPGMIVVDAFAGVGGNSIQFALKGARVIAIDLDPTRLKCAYQNAKVYGVADKIDFICCDFFHFAAKWTEDNGSREQIDVVFLSPPWGGPSYMDKKDFFLDEGITPDGFDIFYASRAMTPNIAYFLPKNTSVKQLMSLVDPGSRLEIEQSCLNKKVKLITAYYGNLANSGHR